MSGELVSARAVRAAGRVGAVSARVAAAGGVTDNGGRRVRAYQSRGFSQTALITLRSIPS
jgi:hypothetical protein